MTSVRTGMCHVSTRACVYALFDPRTGVPFYIGIGREVRPKEHLAEANGKSRSLRANSIRKLRHAGIADTEMFAYLAFDLPADVARCTEEWLVAAWGRRSLGTGPLTNMTAGGERNDVWPTIHARSQAQARRRDAVRAAMARPEVRAKVRAALARPEVRAKIAAAARAAHARRRAKREADLLADRRAQHAEQEAKRKAEMLARRNRLAPLLVIWRERDEQFVEFFGSSGWAHRWAKELAATHCSCGWRR